MKRILSILLLALAVPSALRAAEVVLGPFEPLRTSHLEKLVRAKLGQERPGARFELHFREPALPLDNPATVATRLEIVEWSHDAQTGRFHGLLRAWLEDGPESRIRFSGRARERIRLPVPRFHIAAGQRLTSDMLEWSWVPASLVRADTVRDLDELLGLEVRRSLAPGRPVRLGRLREPRLVRRGDRVTIVYEVPGLRLSAVGRALEEGGLGDVIRLANADSGKVLQGRITGIQKVAVLGPGAE